MADHSASASFLSLTFATPLGGVTQADQWRVTTSFDTYDSDVTTNWERNDTTGFDILSLANLPASTS